MKLKSKMVLWLILLAFAFGSGFLWRYSEMTELRAELREARDDLQAAESRMVGLQVELRLANLRDLASLMYVETTVQNYERARGYSTQFFDALGEFLDSQESSDGASLEPLLARRDMVTAALAQADPAVATEVRGVLTSLHEMTGEGK